jgi:iduronate 2-sulfatase
MNISFFLLLCFAPLAFAADKPNVLFIAVDDLRPQLGCYGDKVVKSPHIDRLASRGLVFERAYCQMALCSPSRISLLSGRRPETTRVYTIDRKLTARSHLPHITTLPQAFKNNGYHTRSFGKVYHTNIDDDLSWSEPAWHSPQPRLGPRGVAARAALLADAKKRGEKPPGKGKGSPGQACGPFEAVDCEDTDLHDGATTSKALGELQEYAKRPDQPFFLAVGFSNPHLPWVAPQKYFDLYDPARLNPPEGQIPPKDAPAFAATTGSDFRWYAGVPAGPPSADYARECLRAYLAAISYVDAQVGRLLDTLEQTGLAKNTIIVLWGDHGYYMGEHGWWGGKHNNYDGATRAPLIVAAPGQQTAGRKCAALVEFVDIFPSLIEIAGLPEPKDASELEGVSFAPLLAEPERPWKTAVFSQYPKAENNLGTAMRTDRYRYVEWRKGGQVTARELYDYQTDPAESQNLAASPANAALLETLAARMKAGWKAARPTAK